MKNLQSTLTKALPLLAIAGMVAAFTMQPVAAQTAKKLKCSGCIKSKQIKNNAIKGTDIKNNAVTGSKIAPDAVDGSKISDGAVNSAIVADESLTAADLGDEAGVDFVGGFMILPLDIGVDTVVRSIGVTVPRAGFVILNASGDFSFGANGLVRCSLTTGTAIEGSDRLQAGDLADAHSQGFGMTEGFVVPAGTTTFNLVCREITDSVTVNDSDLTAIYAPTQY